MSEEPTVYIAAIRANTLGKILITANAYRACGATFHWEQSELNRAKVKFDELVFAMAAVDARLAALDEQK